MEGSCGCVLLFFPALVPESRRRFAQGFLPSLCSSEGRGGVRGRPSLWPRVLFSSILEAVFFFCIVITKLSGTSCVPLLFALRQVNAGLLSASGAPSPVRSRARCRRGAGRAQPGPCLHFTHVKRNARGRGQRVGSGKGSPPLRHFGAPGRLKVSWTKPAPRRASPGDSGSST